MNLQCAPWRWLGVLLLVAAAGGCAQRFSYEYFTMPPGADVDVVVAGSSPTVEVRNGGDWIADLEITAKDRPTVVGPPLPMPPGAAWEVTLEGGGELRVHNKGDRAADVRLWTPGWTTLRVRLYPQGRNGKEVKRIVDEPGADDVYREPKGQ
jgi:hypothetical protein